MLDKIYMFKVTGLGSKVKCGKKNIPLHKVPPKMVISPFVHSFREKAQKRINVGITEGQSKCLMPLPQAWAGGIKTNLLNFCKMSESGVEIDDSQSS